MVYSPLRPNPNNKRGEGSALAHAFGAPSSGEGSTSGGYRVKLKRSPNPEKKRKWRSLRVCHFLSNQTLVVLCLFFFFFFIDLLN